MTTIINGADYRVKAKHPRRDGPLVISAADGTLIAKSGDSVAQVPQDYLASMLANGYLEPVNERRKKPRE